MQNTPRHSKRKAAWQTDSRRKSIPALHSLKEKTQRETGEGVCARTIDNHNCLHRPWPCPKLRLCLPDLELIYIFDKLTIYILLGSHHARNTRDKNTIIPGSSVKHIQNHPKTSQFFTFLSISFQTPHPPPFSPLLLKKPRQNVLAPRLHPPTPPNPTLPDSIHPQDSISQSKEHCPYMREHFLYMTYRPQASPKTLLVEPFLSIPLPSLLSYPLSLPRALSFSTPFIPRISIDTNKSPQALLRLEKTNFSKDKNHTWGIIIGKLIDYNPYRFKSYND